MELGDQITYGLSLVGVTEESIQRWLKLPSGCGCGARRRRLNLLSRWAKQITSGNTANAGKKLKRILRRGLGENPQVPNE